MRVVLKNFRCHTDGSFEFPDQGLIALAGSNGSGKSSLLKGICYGFYGKIPGKVKKPYAHGKTTCSVEIDYLDMHIERHARPKKLLVTYGENVYEEDPAQDVIHKVLGMNYGEFLAAAYVVQRGNASILSLSSADQVKFIETLANSSAERYKEEIKEKIKSTDREILKITSEINILNAQKEEKQGLYPNVPTIPQEIEEGMDPQKVREKIEILSNSLTDYQQNLDTVRLKLEKTRAEEKKRAEVESKMSSLKNEIKFLRGVLDENPGDDPEDRLSHLNEEIAQIKMTITYYRRYLSYLKDQMSLERALEEHNQSVERKLSELLPHLVDDDTIQTMEDEIGVAEEKKREYDSLKALYDIETAKKENARRELRDKFRVIKNLPGLSDTADVKTPSKMIECLTKQLEEKEDALHSLVSQTRRKMECPACKTLLSISEDETTLEPADESSAVCDVEEIGDLIDATHASISIIKDYISEVKRLSKDLNIKIAPLMDEPPDPMRLHKNLMKVKRIKKEYEDLVTKTLPSSLDKMRISLENAGKEFNGEECSKEETDTYISELEEDLHSKISERDALSKRIEEDSARKREIDAKMSSLSKLSLPKISGPSSRELETQIGKMTQKFADISTEIQDHRKILDNVTDYEHYQRVLSEISGLDEKIDDFQERLKRLERKLEGLYGLEEAEKEAEVLALEETISSINEHAKIYLDQMFSDPIMVRLECVKDKGKHGLKFQLNTTIDYKGDTYDDVEELSGGERQRCDMAFLLAVNDMLGSGILILDECLNELDALANTEILILIRDICGGSKMILVISHEAVRGVFDAEISVAH